MPSRRRSRTPAPSVAAGAAPAGGAGATDGSSAATGSGRAEHPAPGGAGRSEHPAPGPRPSPASLRPRPAAEPVPGPAARPARPVPRPAGFAPGPPDAAGAPAPAPAPAPVPAPVPAPRPTPAVLASPARLAARAGGGHRPGAAATPPPGPPPVDLGRSLTRVATLADAETLAAALLHPGRTYPVVVVSVPSGRDEPWIDAEAVRSAVQGLADVAVLPTGAISWRLADLLPPRADVYGGAGRVYPPGVVWQGEPWRAPVRFAYGEREGPRAVDALVSDALAAVATSRRLSSAPRRQRSARGTVRTLVPPSRALVQLADDGIATIWSELTAPGVPIERLVVEGQQVHGSFDPETRRLDVTAELPPAATLAAAYPPGSVVLCRVEEVRADVVHLAPAPGAVVEIPRERVTGNPLDRLTELFTPGETVLARVTGADAAGLTLRLDDVDDDEPVLTAVALLPGGPPWLAEPVREEDEPAEVHPAQGAAGGGEREREAHGATLVAEPAEATDAGHSPSPLDLRVARATEALESQVRTLRVRARELEARVIGLEAKVRNQRTALRQEKVRQRSTALRGGLAPSTADVPPVEPAGFADPNDQFRHEVYLEWVARIPAGQKAELALPEYAIGPAFLDSIEQTGGVDRAKVVQVVVEVLTGLAEQLDGRDLHPLRTAESGGSAPLTRDGGWTAWRVALQRESPAARRLHYWRRGAEVELARVVVHDDLRM